MAPVALGAATALGVVPLLVRVVPLGLGRGRGVVVGRFEADGEAASEETAATLLAAGGASTRGSSRTGGGDWAAEAGAATASTERWRRVRQPANPRAATAKMPAAAYHPRLLGLRRPAKERPRLFCVSSAPL